MQKKLIKLYWQPGIIKLIPEIAKCLEQIYPQLDIVKAGEMAINDGYDPSRYQYDALCLLKDLPDNELSLCIISEDIYYTGYRFLYGAAIKQKAIVSSFRSAPGENLLKEACHEVGHALGLTHCRGRCLMHISRSGRKLQKKPLRLCSHCRSKLDKVHSSANSETIQT